MVGVRYEPICAPSMPAVNPVAIKSTMTAENEE